MMQRLFLVTGASGHVGSNIARQLAAQGESVRCLVLPRDRALALQGLNVELAPGDVCDQSSLVPFFAVDQPTELYLIHAAGIVSITREHQQRIYDVNVTGTKNIVELCLAHGVKRLVYVSSVHAIPERYDQAIVETRSFDAAAVAGLYAKTKAEATKLVQNAGQNGLDVVVVHPSGVIGPGDFVGGHCNQMVIDYLNGSLIAGVEGGYDFVDVRDVASGTIAAALVGQSGECYILSNRYFSVRELFDLLAAVSGNPRIRFFLPMWLAKATAPLAEVYYRLRRQPPLFTSYSLTTLTSNTRFSHTKADRALGYQVRTMRETLHDTVVWLREQGKAK